ncbi:MAG: hypothetical protein ACYC6Y_26525 [Thermoguttaceae bacterium]
MIAPIREIVPLSESRSRTPRDVRRLVASLFLDGERGGRPEAPPMRRWKAWLIVSWASLVTLIYLAEMLDLF